MKKFEELKTLVENLEDDATNFMIKEIKPLELD